MRRGKAAHESLANIVEVPLDIFAEVSGLNIVLRVYLIGLLSDCVIPSPVGYPLPRTQHEVFSQASSAALSQTFMACRRL